MRRGSVTEVAKVTAVVNSVDLSDENGCRVFTKLSTKTKPKLKAKINSKRSRT